MNKLPIYEIELAPDTVGEFAVSLVDKPAVQYDFLYFKDEKRVTFAASESEERVVFGVVMLADTPIYRNTKEMGEHYVLFPKEAIKWIVQQFFKAKNEDAVTLAHQFEVQGVYMFESYIIDRSMGINPPNAFADIPDGSWVGKFKVENEAVWEEIKNGTFKGFSVEGIFSYKSKVESEEQFALTQLHLINELLTNKIKQWN